jgi:extracellular elastinolytic metalloproteinase
VTKGSPAKPLTGPAAGRPAERALGYVRSEGKALGLAESDVEDLVVTGESVSAHAGVRHVFVRQRVNGLEVYGADANLSVGADGSILVFGNSFLADAKLAANRESAALDAAAAVAAAARHVGLEPESFEALEQRGGVEQQTVLSDGGVATGPIEAKLVYQPVAADELRLAWQVDMDAKAGPNLYRMTVDAETGEVLNVENYTSHDNWDAVVGAASGLTAAAGAAGLSGAAGTSSLAAAGAGALAVVTPNPVIDGSSYRVYPLPLESPNDGDRELVTNPADALASPFGWHDTDGAPGPEFTVTRGNNTHTYADPNNANVAQPGMDAEGGPSLTFDFPLDLTQQPATYRDAAVTNLFYWCNISHDVFYKYGFDEPSGNFQVNNYGRGGVGGDDVRCEAQDGGGINNANFSTPAADGGRPRMQMYLWNVGAGAVVPQVTIDPPSSAAGVYEAVAAAFGPATDEIGVAGPVALADDGSGAPTEACDPLIGFPAGAIALIDRGTCPFVQKVSNAQAAGAVGVIVANNVAGAPITMGGTDPSITISSVMVSQADGATIRAGLPATGLVNTPADGDPLRDGSLEAGIVIHEYAHGVSLRLTGGPGVNCLGGQEQMGEGWSDYYGIAFLMDLELDDPEGPRGMAPYALWQDDRGGGGIRPRPYSRNMEIQPFTYDSIKTGGWLNGASLSQPHGIGHGWAAILWDMTWDLIEKHGFNSNVYGAWNTGGNNRALQYVTDGLKFQGCNPGFVAGRDGILAAVEALDPGDVCTVWAAFARRGVGHSAIQGTTNRNDNDEAFDTHPACREGFRNPVKANYGELNVRDAGDSVPLRFDVGRNFGPVLASNSPFSRRVDCETLAVPGAEPPFITPRELPVDTSPAGNSGLKGNSAGVYTYNWETEEAWAGTCRELVLTRTDGVQHRAFFEFVAP